MEKCSALGLFVGTGRCNADCKHCAGKPHRDYAPYCDGFIDETLIANTLVNCWYQGARRLTISSSGEPTLSPLAVTRTLILADTICRSNSGRIKYDKISLYTNGIRIDEDKSFAETFFPLWKSLGLTDIYVTVLFPRRKLSDVRHAIHRYGFKLRANVMLSRETVATLEDFRQLVFLLEAIGFDSVSAWPIRNMNDERDAELSPPQRELDLIEEWAKSYPFPVRVLLGREEYETGQKLTLFPNGVLSSSWCN
jgi:MoaA/NifB/PqqE/SkfB family radical SAM enzyme